MKHRKLILWTRSWMALALLAAAFVMVGCTAGEAGTSSVAESTQLEPTASIKVIGYGEALGEPDEAQVTVGVETFSPKVDDATKENQAVISAILDALDEAGIATKDIQTSNYSLWAEQKYGDNGPEGIAGYHISNQVNVIIRDVSKLGDILSSVTGAGANSIYGVQFSVADPAALEAEAREKALNDAHQRAESLAQLSGLALGEIVAIDETLGQYPSPTREMGLGGFGGGAAEGATSISPGQLSYQNQVQVTYSIRGY
ncbi:MAG: SIMPL domain-containing protein [Candidatus Promineifilaceae bacterium]